MPRPFIDRSNDHLASAQNYSENTRRGVTKVSGVRGPVYKLGCDYSEALETPDESRAGTVALIQELQTQLRARKVTS